MKKLTLVAAAMTALLAIAPEIPPAHAETTLCTEITSLPFTITVQGVYCLKQNLNVNLSAPGSVAITINAGNVTIDFNGWRVNNQAPASNQGRGVYALNRKHITLKNGFIRGFAYGVFLEEDTTDASSSHLVEEMKIADSGFVGILVDGDKSVIRDNRVLATGGGSGPDANGIILRKADEGVVIGNIVSTVSETNASNGISVFESIRIKVIGNEVSGVSGGVSARAMRLSDVDHSIFVGNRMLNNPGTGTGGISDAGASDNVVCGDNEAAGFTATPFSACAFSDGNRKSFD